MKKQHSIARGAILLTTALLTTATFAQPAAAQDDKKAAVYVPEEQIEDKKALDRQGWDGTLGLTAQISLAQNSNVVGQPNGTSFLFGLGLTGGLDYIYKRHELRNTLQINESFARTPVLDELIKTNDLLQLESLYNYFLFTRVGLFGRLDLSANAFTTSDIRADPVNYAITQADGTVDTRSNQRRLLLADPFGQLTLNQSVGVFADILKKREINWTVRLGFGARETLADGVVVISDNADTTDLVEAQALANVFQAGGELFTGIKGELFEKRMKYELGASAMVPFINNDPQDRGAFELMRVGAAGQLAFSVFEWMSLNLQTRILNDPQLLDEVQIQNNILLSFQYSFIEREQPKTKAGPSPEDIAKKKAAEAEKKAAEAEKKAAEAEKKAAEAEKKAAEAAKKAAEAEERAKELEAKENSGADGGTDGGTDGGSDTTKPDAPKPAGGAGANP